MAELILGIPVLLLVAWVIQKCWDLLYFSVKLGKQAKKDLVDYANK